MMNTQFNRRVLIDLFVWNDDQDSSRHIIYVRAAPRAGPAPHLAGVPAAQREDGQGRGPRGG